MITAGPAGVALAADLAKSGEAVKSGPIGLGVILLLCIACYFLFKSMSKHLRHVREDFPPDEGGTAHQVTDPSAGSAGAASVDLHKPPGTTRPAKPAGPSTPPPVHP